MSNPTTFDILIANYQAAEQQVNDLNTLFGNPICGMPGFGFKAARKAQLTRNVANTQLAQARYALRNYVRDSKASKERRTRRYESVKSLIPSFTLD